MATQFYFFKTGYRNVKCQILFFIYKALCMCVNDRKRTDLNISPLIFLINIPCASSLAPDKNTAVY